MIDHGRIVADDTPARLKANFAGDRISVLFGDDADAARAAARTLAVDRAAVVTQDGAGLEIRVAGGPAELPRLLREFDADGTPVLAAELARPTLDDVFLNLTGRSLREGKASTAPAAYDRTPQEISA